MLRQRAERKQKRKLEVAMAAVGKTMAQGKQGTEVDKRRVIRLVEALREKMKEEMAAGRL